MEETFPYQVFAWRARGDWQVLSLFSEFSDAEAFVAHRQERFPNTPCVLMAFGHIMFPSAFAGKGRASIPVDRMEEECSRA